MSSQQQQQQQPSSGPPYASPFAILGGVPQVIPDVPISAVFIVMYLTSAITNIVIFRRNLGRKYKFLPNAFLIAFSMSRVATLVLRIAWATHQHNIRLAIAAQILVNAGILIIYVLNLVFAQRILRAENPPLGWHRALSIFFKLMYAGIAGALVMVITATVLSLYTLDTYTRMACRDVQLAAGTFLFVFTTLPLFMLVLASFVRAPALERESFGQGSMRTKKIILAASSVLCVIISGFKMGTAWMPPRLASTPAWYQSKPAFYCFGFALEILILLILVPTRIDKRFFVPNGSKQPGHYTALAEKKQGNTTADETEEEETEEKTHASRV